MGGHGQYRSTAVPSKAVDGAARAVDAASSSIISPGQTCLGADTIGNAASSGGGGGPTTTSDVVRHDNPPSSQTLAPASQRRPDLDPLQPPTCEGLIDGFKRSGHFDALRKSMLEGFHASPEGKRIARQLAEFLDAQSANLQQHPQQQAQPLLFLSTNDGLAETVNRQAQLLAILNKAPVLDQLPQAIRNHLMSDEIRRRIRNGVYGVLDKIRNDARQATKQQVESKHRPDAVLAPSGSAPPSNTGSMAPVSTTELSDPTTEGELPLNAPLSSSHSESLLKMPPAAAPHPASISLGALTAEAEGLQKTVNSDHESGELSESPLTNPGKENTTQLVGFAAGNTQCNNAEAPTSQTIAKGIKDESVSALDFKTSSNISNTNVVKTGPNSKDATMPLKHTRVDQKSIDVSPHEADGTSSIKLAQTKSVGDFSERQIPSSDSTSNSIAATNSGVSAKRENSNTDMCSDILPLKRPRRSSSTSSSQTSAHRNESSSSVSKGALHRQAGSTKPSTELKKNTDKELDMPHSDKGGGLPASIHPKKSSLHSKPLRHGSQPQRTPRSVRSSSDEEDERIDRARSSNQKHSVNKSRATPPSLGRPSSQSTDGKQSLHKKRDQEKIVSAAAQGKYSVGSLVAAFVLVNGDGDDDSDDDMASDTMPSQERPLKESCYQVVIEAFNPADRIYTVVDPDPDSDCDQTSWNIPEHKIVDFKGLTKQQRAYTVGDRVFSLFRDNDSDNEQTTEFYQAEVVRVLTTGVAVRFEDGDTSSAAYDEIFKVDDVDFSPQTPYKL
ncbi:hypothetical protein BSLG_003884 [Batrachochytrium salamandrivorans]|nr:hypothetical protein BASA62_009962 [Batrachochytrium salamandrivorans]KAH9250396.1 hypothetical protein BASA81_011804 [Batrachochytrium salamandrivorans]KAJ1341455.1 hypothetical protein BSLG_003884 [Batrachochytrium salamandrivorans]